ncbi:hypothetical protein QN277_017742 [Acacia crassicarpa]|uniref:Reverse transcriptase domain-containing protein n=1 Tax=Acacia crassicarpa TaxID=499986 RepID=A0AAE1MUA0_9FABA|nr:hypothetical protein QN277_017742 [Acacia crassicarpa]
MGDIVYWNVRGACGNSLIRNIQLACLKAKPSLLILSETKCEQEDKFRCFNSMGFDGIAFVPSLGRSGGLVAVWRTSEISVGDITLDRQFIHFQCRHQGRQPFWLTAVYAIPSPSQKQRLWAELEIFAASMSEAWVLLGDFNDISSSTERIGGFGFNPARSKLFNDRMRRCKLTDLGAVGPQFTWRGPRVQGNRRLYERLDRAIANTDFLSAFSDFYIQVLPRTRFSDHNPLCLKYVTDGESSNLERPFRFEAMWIKHENYNDFLQESWISSMDINQSLDCFKNSLKSWNKELFGMVEQQKRSIMNRLDGIQKSRAYPYSEFLCNLEIELQESLERILKLEEIKWFQKSRNEWIIKGDRNTRFYHLKSKARRRRNRISMLKNDEGSWIDNEEELKRLVTNYFRNIYCANEQGSVGLVTRAKFPAIDRLTLLNISKMPEDEEIRRALFAMGCYKAPGVDGFPPIFYKSNWSTVGAALCSFVKNAFLGKVSLDDANKTLISLIPKRENVELVAHFRPISLCTVHFKCITKIIALRLREVMNDIVSPFQTSFIKGRSIHDNIVVGQEILHIMSKNRSRKGLMAVKIDLEKAYDRISWVFLKQVLLDIGLDTQFVDFLINCVSSVSYNVLWNGSQTEFFKPSRGLRQGDPISPLLFVLCMDRLSHVICDAVEDGRWRPIRVSNSGPNVSHLMFADDLLLFGVASESQTTCMMKCLQDFMATSGGRVNKAKSSIFFSPRVPLHTKLRIKDMTQMQISCEMGRYLGFPLSRNRRLKADFQYVIDRVSFKLSTWKANCLSMAGRIMLAKSVVSSIPLYPMHVAMLPKSVCYEIERLQRNFIWGHNEATKCFHPIGWEQITRPKQYGGLGFRRLCSLNQACGVKMAWKLIEGSKGLWTDILSHRYMRREGTSLLSCRPGDSRVWKFICSQKELVDRGSKWQIRNGLVANFFSDCWVGDGVRVKDFCIRQLSEEEEHSLVADWAEGGSWSIDKLSTIVSLEGLRRIAPVLPPRPEAENDCLVWGATVNGRFTVRSAYFLIEPNNQSLYDNLFKDVWKWHGVERVRVFMWKVALNKLPTNAWRSSWLQTSALCECCNSGVEDILHILRDCMYAKPMWESLIKPRYYLSFFSLNLRDWLSLNLNHQIGRGWNGNWSLFFGVAIWKFWDWRNKCIFEHGFSKPSSPLVAIMSLLNRFIADQDVLGGPEPHNSQLNEGWVKPPLGWYKFNVDGATMMQSFNSGCGGVLRDCLGNWIVGFSKAIGICHSSVAEEWTILEGLQIARDLGIKKIIVESDAQEVIKLILDDSCNSGSNIVFQIRLLLAMDWEVDLRVVPRDVNRVADALAKMGISSSAFYSVCPMYLKLWIAQECLGFNSLYV